MNSRRLSRRRPIRCRLVRLEPFVCHLRELCILGLPNLIQPELKIALERLVVDIIAPPLSGGAQSPQQAIHGAITQCLGQMVALDVGLLSHVGQGARHP